MRKNLQIFKFELEVIDGSTQFLVSTAIAKLESGRRLGMVVVSLISFFVLKDKFQMFEEISEPKLELKRGKPRFLNKFSIRIQVFGLCSTRTINLE
jgi:hypothetical protein